MNQSKPDTRGMRVLASALLLCAMAPVAYAQDTKIGYVDVEKLRKNSPQAIAAGQKLHNEFAPRNDHLESQIKGILKLEKSLESDGDVMSAERRGELEREIQRKRRDFLRERDEMREDLAIRRNEELGKLQEHISTVVREIASREGYDLVLTQAVALHASERIDMTELVLEELGSR